MPYLYDHIPTIRDLFSHMSSVNGMDTVIGSILVAILDRERTE